MSSINWHIRNKAKAMSVPSDGGDFAVVELQTKNEDCGLTIYFDTIALPCTIAAERLAHARIAAAALNCELLDILNRAYWVARETGGFILANEIYPLISDSSIPQPGDDVDSQPDDEPEDAA